MVEHSYTEWYAAQPAWDLPDPGAPWPDELRSHLTVSLDSLADRPIFLRLGYLLLLLRRDDPPAARARFMEVRQHARHATDEWFRGASPDLVDIAGPASIALMALSDGLFFSNQLDTPTWDSTVFGDLVTRLSRRRPRPFTAPDERPYLELRPLAAGIRHTHGRSAVPFPFSVTIATVTITTERGGGHSGRPRHQNGPGRDGTHERHRDGTAAAAGGPGGGPRGGHGA